MEIKTSSHHDADTAAVVGFPDSHKEGMAFLRMPGSMSCTRIQAQELY